MINVTHRTVHRLSDMQPAHREAINRLHSEFQGAGAMCDVPALKFSCDSWTIDDALSGFEMHPLATIDGVSLSDWLADKFTAGEMTDEQASRYLVLCAVA